LKNQVELKEIESKNKDIENNDLKINIKESSSKADLSYIENK